MLLSNKRPYGQQLYLQYNVNLQRTKETTHQNNMIRIIAPFLRQCFCCVNNKQMLLINFPSACAEFDQVSKIHLVSLFENSNCIQRHKQHCIFKAANFVFTYCCKLLWKNPFGSINKVIHSFKSINYCLLQAPSTGKSSTPTPYTLPP